MLLKETIVIHRHDKENRLAIVVRPRFHSPGSQTIEELVRYGIFLIERATIQV